MTVLPILRGREREKKGWNVREMENGWGGDDYKEMVVMTKEISALEVNVVSGYIYRCVNASMQGIGEE